MLPRDYLLLAIIFINLTACSTTAPHTVPPSAESGTISPSASLGPSVAKESGAPRLKAPLLGLIDRQGVPDAKNPNAVSITGVVINLDWAQVEPQAGQLDHGALDRAFADVDAFSHRLGHPVGVRLRIVGGIKAPDWLKDRSGRVHVEHHAGAADQGVEDFTGDLPRFWTHAYGQAYADLQRRLAERYDNDPRLSDVVIGRCATVWAEPFVRQQDDGVRIPLFDAGFTVDQDERCFAEQIQAHQVWHSTRSTLSVSPYTALARDHRLGQDMSVAKTSIEQCRNDLGERCVLANNSIRSPLQGDEYADLYATLIAKGRPLTFQTAKRTRIGSLTQTLNWAANTARACSVELPSGYQDTGFAPTRDLTAASQRLADNCR